MRLSTVLAALAVALACLALAWVTMPSDPFARNAPPTPETFAIGFDIPSVSGVAVSSSGLEAQVWRGDDGVWTLTLPTTDGGSTTWPANVGAVRSLLTELSTQAIEEGGAPDGGPEGEPLARIGVTVPEGETTIEVLDQPLGGRLPVRVTSPDGAARAGFVPADRFRPLDAGQLAALAEPRPLDGPGVITRLAVTFRDAPGFTIERAGGVWRVAEDASAPRSPRLHQLTIRAVIDDLKAIRAASVVVPAAIGRDAPARTDPFLTIETMSDLPRTAGTARRRSAAALTIAAEPAPDGLTDAISTRSSGTVSDELQIRLDPEAFPVLPADLGSLLDPTPLPFRPSEASAFRVGASGAEVDLRRTIDGWMSGDRRLSPGETEALDYLLVTLAQPATRVRLADPQRRFVGTPIAVESLSSSGPVGLVLVPGGADLPFEVTDGTVVWEIDELGARFDEAVSDLPRATPAP